jgi:uncharacterized membrane protein
LLNKLTSAKDRLYAGSVSEIFVKCASRSVSLSTSTLPPWATVTGIVLIIVAVTKTLEGAWIVLLLIPLIVAVFKATRQHYQHVASDLTLKVSG